MKKELLEKTVRRIREQDRTSCKVWSNVRGMKKSKKMVRVNTNGGREVEGEDEVL